MSRPRIYASNAERQRAYRRRKLAVALPAPTGEQRPEDRKRALERVFLARFPHLRR